ncbi:MAG: nucleotidyltransferase family protein [Bacteroidales bacterium]|nr:nucleotidyltransferase family protein [Bacteroidales bacterium]MCF8328266.1 nucleotidyltransferase family protein [Bacteroidales bacterium]
MNAVKRATGYSNSYIQKFSPELKFLILCMKHYLQTAKEEELKEYSARIRNWDFFYNLILVHRLVFVVNHCIQTYPKLFPSKIKILLHNKQQQNVAAMMSLTGDLVNINRLFKEHNLSLTTIKGPVLAKSLYGDTSNTRVSRDLDILIDKDKLTQIDKLLQDNGFDLIINNKIAGCYLPQDYLAYELQTNHHIAYRSKKTKNLIEVHWQISRYKKIQAYEFDSAELLNEQINVLSEENNLLYLLWHGSIHHWRRLFWLLDIARFLQKNHFNWEKLIHTAEAYHIQRGVLSGIFLAAQLFDIRIPEPVRQKYLQDKKAIDQLTKLDLKLLMLNDNIPQQQTSKLVFYKNLIRSIHAEKLYSFTLNKRFKDKARILIANFHSPANREYIKLPQNLFFLYIPLRPFIIILMWFKKIRLKKKYNI